ncbi:ArnT family glycosyltransferase [Spirilliplanes yamanashiensis]|uniref:Glycosyl transferase n=1 Tax=Spirilliplanes yamanashiensis TaxID=42233 RepID=A0A8J3YA37_9ACTN|nr:glycosyltransferase family 39 protein [Spirilliplanes yamanashiensis]MDP9815746.1 4-amino-4-deoxy-L-arabinose transferase-like glycosyltransferase [Spirilliplanes yamanashiensis]GIJ04000.1 glycosyl transferase [Spirilliplanes yamanashiensis]
MTSTLPVPPIAARPTANPAPRRGPAALLRGRPDDPAWARPALLALLAATAVLYLWGLGASGWANAFYSAAVQAGSQSWTAFFFGSSDAANSITVDKTPASLWVMALSARVFGVNAWNILVPQAVMGVATVAVVFATVRRWYGPAAGLLAGAVLASTPVAALMFRFNNPDALLVLLMAVAAYATVRAIERGQTAWLVAAGTAIGFGFLAKMLQALLIVPALWLAYLVAGPPGLGRRLVQLLAAGAAMVVSAGWYILVVELVPASMRPYIGGSQGNSILELALGYNGLGRLNGEETGSVGGGGGWGTPGWARMFDAEQGGQIAWLLPAAVLLLAAGLAVTARAPRTDRARAGFLVWGGWLVVTAAVFSLMQGIFHAYYTVALAPAVGAVVGMGAVTLWRLRRHPAASLALAGVVAVSAVWAFVLLGRSAEFVPWLRWTVLAAGLPAAAAIAVTSRLRARVAALAAAVALGSVLAGPAAYAVDTAATPHTGSIPSAGPQVAGGRGGPGGPGGRPGGGRGTFPGAPPGGLPGGGAPGRDGRAGGGGMGGLLDAATVGDRMRALLTAEAGSYTWVAAAVGSQNASGYQLATGEPVMAVGGFNGSDPSPTLAQFQRYVAEGRIHYFIGGGGAGGGRGASGGSSAAAQIAAWVSATFTPQTVDGVTVYDLTAATTA